MVFSSIEFLFVFLPCALALYYLTPAAARNITLLILSMVFYICGAGGFIFVISGLVLVNWGIALIIDRSSDKRRIVFLTLGVMINLGFLGFYKYTNFVVTQINALLKWGQTPTVNWQNILLPIGISFITFHSLSYLIDVKRGKSKPFTNPVDFALYIFLFPQLIAGPIVRYSLIAEQIRNPRTVTTDLFNKGAARLCLGLLKKCLVADSVSPLADAAFNTSSTDLTSLTAWLGALAYTVQIYFDFSGYSDMAIGLGHMFGFTLPENFNRPYSATSITDFWRRWHMTLSSWFRDYLFIPLGGSRGSTLRTSLNLAIVFITCGLWHGANWTFILWGIYHGIILGLERALGWRDITTSSHAPIVRRGITFLLVLLGWVLFRATTIDQAADFYHALFVAQDGDLPRPVLIALTHRSSFFLIAGVLSIFLPSTYTTGHLVEQDNETYNILFRYALILLGLPIAAILVTSSTYSPFLYFQF